MQKGYAVCIRSTALPLSLPTTVSLSSLFLLAVRFGVFGSKQAKSNQSQPKGVGKERAGWKPIKAFKESIFK